MSRKNCLSVLIFLIPGLLLTAATDPAGEAGSDILNITAESALSFTKLALKCIGTEYPNKPGHVINNENEVQNPRVLHPAFFGCFDWHSAVHGHWLLVRILKLFPNLPNAESIRAALSGNLNAGNIKSEVAYFRQPGRKSFERMYGWAWFLKLVEELHGWDDPDGIAWRASLVPLEKEIAKRYLDFLPKQTYAIRTGVHPNTAFGLAFALDYARTIGYRDLETLIVERSRSYFLNDINCPAEWEPGGEDFFSPCLMEADLMRRILNPEEFQVWFAEFLPGIASEKPTMLLNPAVVTDRSDGKLVHLDGLNLSRAWCMKHIAQSLPEKNPARRVLFKSAMRHARDALGHINSGDYAGEHWLASFATYLMTQ